MKGVLIHDGFNQVYMKTIHSRVNILLDKEMQDDRLFWELSPWIRKDDRKVFCTILPNQVAKNQTFNSHNIKQFSRLPSTIAIKFTGEPKSTKTVHKNYCCTKTDEKNKQTNRIHIRPRMFKEFAGWLIRSIIFQKMTILFHTKKSYKIPHTNFLRIS